MLRTPVVSSNVSSVGYDAASMVLEVQFHSGAVYQYFGVPQAVSDGLMRAASKGAYFSTQIKERFRYRQVG